MSIGTSRLIGCFVDEERITAIGVKIRFLEWKMFAEVMVLAVAYCFSLGCC